MARQEFTRDVRAKAFARAKGHCEKCTAHLYVGKHQFDHIVADSIGGEPTLSNCQVLCNACHGEKTAKVDTPRAAKTKRQRDKHIGAVKRRPAFSHPFLKRKINGTVERRT